MSIAEKRVCVTGANGYIGAHVVRELLSAGASVVATVRGNVAEKSVHLRDLDGSKERLTVVAADVLNAQVWASVLADCDALVHCATAVRFAAKDPQRDIVDVAVKGTRNVLGAARTSEQLKDVIHLSSVAAIFGNNKPEGHQFTDQDWCDDANVESSPYALGKTLSEKEAWELAKPEGGRGGFRLVTLNPGFVLGPVLAKSHLRTSPSIVHDILVRKFPGCPPLNLNVVDVRDVAAAGVKALCLPELSKRLLLTSGKAWWAELAQILNTELPGRKLRTNELPTWLMYLSAAFDKRVTFAFLRRTLHRETLADGESAMTRLGLTYHPLNETLKSTAHSLIGLGLVPNT